VHNNNKYKFDFENSVGFIINRTAKALVYAFDQELRKKVGITFGQWKIIIIVVNNTDDDNNGLTQREIADKLGLEGPTLIPIIDKLEKDGFLLRKVDKNDRRNNRIFLTKKSKDLLDSMINCGQNIKQILLKDISDADISITKNTLEKMWQNIQNEFNLNFAAKVGSNEKSNEDADAIRTKDLYSKIYGAIKIVEKIDSI
jgi:MarR family transcriptional regulator, transcriptional regulator for hemolysin